MMRLAAFGLRGIPPGPGAGGSDTIAEELYSRLARRGHSVTVYCRRYRNDSSPRLKRYRGMRLFHFPTVAASGFDSLLHSCLCTLHIILKNTGDVVHIHNGGNSIWALPLRLFGKRVYIGQDGIDWVRAKWKWYARLYLRLSTIATAYLPTGVIFDNIFAKEYFEKKFHRRYDFIPYGSDFVEPTEQGIPAEFCLTEYEYILFIGRFIPEKGIHYLVEAFRGLNTTKKLVLVGGSTHPDAEYEMQLRRAADERVRFLGFVYKEPMLRLMKYCYCYVQPSDIEGLSPVLLTAMGLEVPVVCSDILENVYAVGDCATVFTRGDVESLRSSLQWALQNPTTIRNLACRGRERARNIFSWEKITTEYETIFQGGD